jgi:hypothetical protein
VITTPSHPNWWLTREGVTHAALHLRQQFHRWYPDAARDATEDPEGVCEHMDDVELVVQSGPVGGACAVGGLYVLGGPRARIVVRMVGNRRDGFTVLHEVAHHLQYIDEEWSLIARPSMPEGKERLVAEKVADAFAATVLIPDGHAASAFAGGVTAAAVRELFRTSAASATACCVRALGQPGQRLVMLTTQDGRPWYADSHGTPLNPGRKLAQPLVAKAVERADDTGTARLRGGGGIVYSTGRTDTDLAVDVAVEDGMVFMVAISTPHDSRVDLELRSELFCGHCDEVYTAEHSTRRCGDCGSWECPGCGRCDCEQPATYCQGCYIQLPLARAHAGLGRCESCE